MQSIALRLIGISTFSLLLAGCQDAPTEDEGVALLTQAISVCDETVPANRIVEGIPAYAQCTASRNAAIYSNNGVDTATSAASSEWKRTQFAGGYQCTELANRYLMFRWNIKWLPSGDAWSWCNSEPPSSSGLVKSTTPVHGDLIVFGKGVCGSDSTYGHVALVDTVDTARSRVTFVEQNQAGRRTDAWSCATCFLHVVANDGSASAAGAGGANASTTATQGGASTGSSLVASGGRSSSRPNTSTAKGGSTVSAGGAPSSAGGQPASGGAASSVAGGRFARGGASSGVGSTRTANGGTTNPSTSAGVTLARGGMPASDSGGASADSSRSSASGGAGDNGTARKTTTGPTGDDTRAAASGGSGDDETSTSVGTRAVRAEDSTADSDAGCDCAVIGAGSSRLNALGLAAVVCALLLRRRSLRRRAS